MLNCACPHAQCLAYDLRSLELLSSAWRPVACHGGALRAYKHMQAYHTQTTSCQLAHCFSCTRGGEGGDGSM
eukprot:4450679-Amphidinium_carterae.1